MAASRDDSTATGVIRHPEVDADRCVHALCATASCQACVAACPRSAWVMDQQSLGFDAEACDGCGLCRPACPESAIAFAPGAFEPLLDQRRATAHVACERAGVTRGPGVVACLHALGERDVSALAARGVEHVRAACGRCEACSRATAATLAAAIGRVNVVRASRGERAIAYLEVDAAIWQTDRAILAGAPPDVDHSRRALFGLGRAPRSTSARSTPNVAVDEPTLPTKFRFVPRIDPATCTGCDACARICPHRAIVLERGGDGRLGYRFDAAHCTGCRLCVDMCDTAAVSLGELLEVPVLRVLLDERTCRYCGVPFHVPVWEADDGSPAASVCGVCRKTDRTRVLFQVHKS